MVKKFEENASPGIQNESGSQALYGLLENKSCYHQLDALFRDKANGTALFKLNISRPGMELGLFSNSEDDGIGTLVSFVEDKTSQGALDRGIDPNTQENDTVNSEAARPRH